jgi:hypothetical protein
LTELLQVAEKKIGKTIQFDSEMMVENMLKSSLLFWVYVCTATDSIKQDSFFAHLIENMCKAATCKDLRGFDWHPSIVLWCQDIIDVAGKKGYNIL